MPQEQSTPNEWIPTTLEETESSLYEAARRSAQRILQRALLAEADAYLAAHAEKRDENGHQMVVRNGYAPERTILTGIGAVNLRRPRVDERKAVADDSDHQRFISGVLPRFLRRTPSVEGVVATLYLKGISGNDFDAALAAIYGEQAGGLSAATVSRLKEVWSQEYEPMETTNRWDRHNFQV